MRKKYFFAFGITESQLTTAKDVFLGSLDDISNIIPSRIHPLVFFGGKINTISKALLNLKIEIIFLKNFCIIFEI